MAGLQPHRLERFMRSTDPDFETKAADVIGLYLDPPQHAVVFCIDEKTAIQALDRIDPILPLSPGRAERHGFEYYRHGTLSLYAAINTHTGEVLGSAMPRHTSDEFVAFLTSVVKTQPRRREIHIIVDNLSAHKTQKVRTFLVAHPNVRLQPLLASGRRADLLITSKADSGSAKRLYVEVTGREHLSAETAVLFDQA